ncbi:MAG TPA: PLP-dependent aminotransferase family protein [Candidatus Sulfotelmatobacter sp.]|nr:PLP-dependent aminotransferase family protein [Candidatus Sulfotelmatobacter sp.]
MSRRRAEAPLLTLHLDAEAAEPLHRQLYTGIRELVLAGRLAPGARLPSSRMLADELAVSRNTVLLALDQLISEGYVEGRAGSGSFIPAELPDPAPAAARSRGERRSAGPRLSQRGDDLAARGARRPQRSGLFAAGLPDTSDFPFELWSRLAAKHWRRPDADLIAATEPRGHLRLRTAIADYLRTVRAVHAGAEQVIVVSGARQAVDFAARLLLDPGDSVWVEEPGYAGIRAVLAAAGARLVPVPMDADGMRVIETGKAPPARLACVAPSHQYPLGVTMSLARRLELLAWARRQSAWIIEDDYDSEFRYAGPPLAALQGLDQDGRVIYVGSFSKVMFPSLRLGYLVVPPATVDAFAKARATLDDHPASAMQPVLAEFIEAGHFAAHVRRMRKRYGERQRLLLAAAERHLAGLLQLTPDPAGMHLLAALAPALARRMDDNEAARRAAAAGINAPALSGYFLGRPTRQGLLLGYAAVADQAIEPAVRKLAAALRVA